MSGSRMSKDLAISRTAVWSHIEELRQLGYGIEADPHQGYRLLHVPDILLEDDLMSRMPEDRLIGRNDRIRETASTIYW